MDHVRRSTTLKYIEPYFQMTSRKNVLYAAHVFRSSYDECWIVGLNQRTSDVRESIRKYARAYKMVQILDLKYYRFKLKPAIYKICWGLAYFACWSQLSKEHTE